MLHRRAFHRPPEVETGVTGDLGGRRRWIAGLGVAAAATVVLVGGGAVAMADEGGTTGSPSAAGTSSSAASAPPIGSSSAQTPGVTARTPPTHAPHLDGEVATVTDGVITVTDHDGFTRTIHISGATSYGDGISLPVEVGEHIHAVGTVDTDGTSLAATEIELAPEPPTPGAGAPPEPGAGPGKAGVGTPPEPGTGTPPLADGAGPGDPGAPPEPDPGTESGAATPPAPSADLAPESAPTTAAPTS